MQANLRTDMFRMSTLLLALVQSENYAAQLVRQSGLSADKLQPQINALPKQKKFKKPRGHQGKSQLRKANFSKRSDGLVNS